MPAPSSRILLTGATGYVGGRLLTALATRGEHVRCLARDPARTLSAADLAERFGVSTHHLAKVLRTLAVAGLVRGGRGTAVAQLRGQLRSLSLHYCQLLLHAAPSALRRLRLRWITPTSRRRCVPASRHGSP